MACPTCDRTMQNVGVGDPHVRVFWCPNCGTLKKEIAPGTDHEYASTEAPRSAKPATITGPAGPRDAKTAPFVFVLMAHLAALLPDVDDARIPATQAFVERNQGDLRESFKFCKNRGVF